MAQRPATLLLSLSLALSFWGQTVLHTHAKDIPTSLLNGHRQTMGCWLADIDAAELLDKALVINLGVQQLYGFICSTGLSGDSYRFYQVEDGRDEWAKLLSFPQLDTKLGWFSTTHLEKPIWDPKNKYLRSEVPKQGETSTCRQFSLYSWQKGRFHIVQVGLSGNCEDNTGDKDLIIFPFVEEVEEGQAAAQADDSKKKN
ncbi:MAG: hypothetical protein N4A65_02495 [Cohaesibacter sp.]|jgi:hypothetical protein|nr:hypothetical protein [Cohaesibacter sp.]